MEHESKWKCDHLHGEVLTAVKRYNDKQFVVKSEKTGRRFLVGVDAFTEPHLSLAHITKMSRQLVEIKE
jgi:hypothetical protein